MYGIVTYSHDYGITVKLVSKKKKKNVDGIQFSVYPTLSTISDSITFDDFPEGISVVPRNHI